MAAEAGRRLDAYENVALKRYMISRAVVVNHMTAAIPAATAAAAKARTPIAELTLASAIASAIGSAGVLRPKHSQLEQSQFSAVQGTPGERARSE